MKENLDNQAQESLDNNSTRLKLRDNENKGKDEDEKSSTSRNKITNINNENGSKYK